MIPLSRRAFSPVVGLLILVAITAVIVAVLHASSIATLGKTKTAPSAVFNIEVAKDVEVEWMPGVKVSYVLIEQIAGDSIPTGELIIITECKNNITKVLPNSDNTHTYCSWGYWVNGTSPYLNMPPKYFGSDPSVNFGNYTTKPGVKMIADEYSNYNRTGAGNTTGMEAMFGENWWTWINKGDTVKIRIVHVPSQTVIFEGETEVI